MRPTVYIETTIPSYHEDSRPTLAGDIERTRVWWDRERQDYECFISAVVLDELSEGDYPTHAACLKLVASIPMLAVTLRAVEVAEVYQARKLMPSPPVRDALHVALASCYRIEYLLTWNCRHLANANKVRHLEAVNTALGLPTPLIITPHMLQPLEGE